MRGYKDPITRCREAAAGIRTDAETFALELLQNFDGKDPTVLIEGAGKVKGMLAAAEKFEAEVKRAFGEETEEEAEERES